MISSIYRKISYILVILMIFCAMPWQDMMAYAEYDPTIFYVDHVTLTRIYEDGGYNVNKTKLTIEGNHLKGADITTVTSSGGYVFRHNNDPDDIDLDTMQQFVVEGNKVGESLTIGSIKIPIHQDSLPSLSKVDSRMVKKGEDDLVLTGSNLSKVFGDPNDSDGVVVEYSAKAETDDGGGTVETPLDEKYFDTSTNQVTLKAKDLAQLSPGLTSLIFSKDRTDYIDFNNNNGYKIPSGTNSGKNEVHITIQNTYEEQFSFLDIMEIENLVMNPNRGLPGDEIVFTATRGLDDATDVFFLQSLTEPYSNENKGTETTSPKIIDGKQRLVTHVPKNLQQGDYYVVLTNKIPDGKDPNKEIHQMLIVEKPPHDPDVPNYDKFTVIDGSQKIRVDMVSPNKGPDSGSKVEVTGSYFGTLNLPDFNSDTEDKKVTVTENGTVMEIEYSTQRSDGSVVTYNGTKVEWARRKIKVIIGSVTKFAKTADDSHYEYSFSKDIDRMSVITQSITDAEKDPVKDVVVETETTLKLQGFPNNVIIKDRGELKNGYTFIRSKTRPEIKEIIPQKIQVYKTQSATPTYKIDENQDRMIAIYGQNFFVHKYMNDQNKEVIRYPIIEFGNGIRLNKNKEGIDSDPNLYLKVLDNQGRIMDGSEGNEMGNKILVEIPKDKTMKTIGKTSVKIINPVRNSTEEGLDQTKPDAVEFVNPIEPEIPIIQEVTPNIVTVEGGETVEILGKKFKDGCKVFIDGKEVSNIQLRGDGQKITFTTPPGREGETQIQVMNPSGGIAVKPFRYVKTYTDPKLIDFSPKKGKTNTLVVVKGDNFLKPDPTATKEEIYKLIGTRVLLEGVDYNQYNIDPQSKEITLKEYTSNVSNPLLKIEDHQVKLSDYYHSVILEDTKQAGKYYILDQNMKDEIVLSDGSSEKYTIQLSKDQNSIKAHKDSGGVYEVHVDEQGLTLDHQQLTLKMLTPFKVNDQHNIIGDTVKVVDINQLYVTIPKLPGDGYYDVTVQNPDTKRDTKSNEDGFYYYTQPSSKPNIVSIDPNEGSVIGGYTIEIKGSRNDDERECFVDNGKEKTAVVINGKTVPSEDVTVSTDGLSLKVVVPKLDIDIKEVYGTDRLSVAVVVVNPDGGSASKEDGFTYIVPISHPRIIKIQPAKGSASGGNVVEITGEDFRFFEPYNDQDRDGSWQLGEKYQDLNGHALKRPIDGKFEVDDGTKGPDDFTGQRVDELKGKFLENYEKIVLPVLPKVYFGDEEAKVVEFANGYLKVQAPRGIKGETDVYVVNNDFGISNKVSYTYEGSSVKINSISPDVGKKQGGDHIEVRGEDFIKSDVLVYEKQGSQMTPKKDTQVLVRFGEITNKNIKREDENSGRIDNSRATVSLDGGLKVTYDGVKNTLHVGILKNQVNYQATLPYHDKTVYVPVSLLKDDQTDTWYTSTGNLDEWIRFEVSDRRLFVERGYAPKVEYISSKQLVVDTPSYHTVGQVPLTVINPDGAEAFVKFEYKNPSSQPLITNITKDGKNPIKEKVTLPGQKTQEEVKIVKVSYKGGNMVSIIGSDFRENATIQIGDALNIDSSKITYELPNRLTFTMPSVDESYVGKFLRAVVSNEDGGNASSDEPTPPIYIQFIKGETYPAIDKVEPSQGPSSGGTEVTISGKDFRENLSVYIGDVPVPKEDITFVDYKTVKIKTPSHVAGTFDVKIENPDGALSDPNGSFTYLSAPTIISVVDPKDENSIIRTISVEGGQKIRIKGAGYSKDAKVVFVPVIEKGQSDENKDTLYIKDEEYTLKEGVEGTDVKVMDEGTIEVTTPEGEIDSFGVMVINADKGSSEIYEGLKYGLPEIHTPTNVNARLYYDQYIKVNWKEVEGAKEYEIYAIIDDHDEEFLGSTEYTSYVYKDLKPKTEYKFIVTALGEYGDSKYSEESNEVETGSKVGPKDEDGKLGEKTVISRIGDTANIIVGEDAYDDAKDIDLTRGSLAGAKKVQVSIPAYVAARYDAGDIRVMGQDFRLKFNPKNFYSDQIKADKDRRDAGVRMMLQPLNQNLRTQKGQILVSNAYKMSASVYTGKDTSSMTYLPAYMQFSLDTDQRKIQMRRIKTLELSYYNEDESKWMPLSQGDGGQSSVMGVVNNLGKFAVIGSRR